MTLEIRLRGRPSAVLDGVTLPGPRGRKSWALLAVLALADRPPSRRTLAALLFPDADDPLGALRWSLSQIRRSFHGYVSADGDPVTLRIDAGCRIDALDADDADIAEPLLDGADGIAGPDFDLWLTATRQRLETAAARHRLDTAAAPVDGRAARVSSLIAAGDHATALRQLREWTSLVRRELQLTTLMSGPVRPGYAADAMARIDAGQAAMAAGAVTAGVEHLRDAVRIAVQRPDERLQATALFALGGSLVHALAAHAGEGVGALRQAAALARRSGDGALAAEALRDLAFVHNASGNVAATRRSLAAALAAAGDDERAISSVRAIEGMHLADRGRHGQGLLAYRRSAELAESTGRIRQAAWAISMASRSLLLREEYETATQYATLSRQLADEERWTAMLPWMDVNLAELDLATGNVEQAERRLEYAWSLSLVLNDWCWQSMTARGLGMVAFARGDVAGAMRWLDEALTRATQDHDRYVWIHAWVQDAACKVSVAAGLPRAAADVARLAAIAAEGNIPDFAVRAELHRAALGDGSAWERARAMTAALDNPALVRVTNRRPRRRRYM